MQRRSIQLIEKWFADHDGDGDFAALDRLPPYSVIGPVHSRSRIIYTTKPNSISTALARSAALHKFSMIGRYGLPARQELKRMKEMAGTRQLFFVGDADPADLLIFRWLQILIGSQRIMHLGVSDRLLLSSSIAIQERFTIRLSRSEREAIALLEEVFPEYPDAPRPRLHPTFEPKAKNRSRSSSQFFEPGEPDLRSRSDGLLSDSACLHSAQWTANDHVDHRLVNR